MMHWADIAKRDKSDGLFQVPTWLIGEVWEHVKPYVNRALEYDMEQSYATEDVATMCAMGSQQLWMIYSHGDLRGVLTTELQQKPRMKVCLIHLCAADDFGELIEMRLPVLEKWAKDNGCFTIEFYGRKGFTRMLDKHGFHHQYTVMSKTIDLNLH